MARQGYDVYRDWLNAPAFQDLLGPVDGLRGLDIGCGEGYNTRLTAARGARMTAADIVPTFVREAAREERRNPHGIRFCMCSGLELCFSAGAFDFVMATMCLMDMPRPADAIREVYRVLKPGGFFQFSILHPCFLTPRWRWLTDESGERTGVECGDYWHEMDGHIERWSFSAAPEAVREKHERFNVPRFTFRLSQWVNTLAETGFVIERMEEPRADEETAEACPYVADTRIVPLFLHVRCRKG